MPDTLTFLYLDAIAAVIQFLRPPNIIDCHVVRDLFYVTSAGSKGYAALKDMLQSGVVGHVVLVESHDLRHEAVPSSEKSSHVDGDGDGDEGTNDGGVFFQISHNNTSARMVCFDAPRATVYTNAPNLPRGFLSFCSSLSTLDLSAISEGTELPREFLSGVSTLTKILLPFSRVALPAYFLLGCSGLTRLDLSPLSGLTNLPRVFLLGCTGLTELDLSPFSQVSELPEGFLQGCTGLTKLNLSPMVRLAKIPKRFLVGCSGLLTLDLTPLSAVSELPEGFLRCCTGLSDLDLSPLSQVTRLPVGFLSECGLTTVKLPTSVTKLPHGLLRGNTSLKALDLSPLANLRRVPEDLATNLPELQQIIASAAHKPLFDAVDAIDRIEMVYV